MTLTADEARGVASLFPGRTAIAVLDARPAAALWWDVFPRSWAAGGVVTRPAALPRSGPVAAIIPPGEIPGPVRTALAQLADDQPFAVLTARAGGTFTHMGRSVRVPAPAYAQTVYLTIEGRQRLNVSADHLPVSVRAVIPERQKQRVVRISGSQEEPLPEGWYELMADPGPVELNVGLEPRRGGDGWVVYREDQAISQPIAPPPPAPLRRLVVVFDRTCPDYDHLSDARRWVRGERTRGERGGRNFTAFGGSAEAAEVPAPTADPHGQQSGLNSGIRNGVLEGLRAAFSEPVPVDVVWFADVAGSGLGKPGGVRLAEWGCGRTFGPVQSNAADAALSVPTYVPGLDLWDDLDGALAEVLKDREPAPVLVVGNSPPAPPEDPHHPFAQLWRLVLPPSTVRAFGQFPELLSALDRRGCPLVAVFPTGHPTPDEAWGDQYQTVQRHVQEAFARVVPTFPVLATPTGVAAGIVQAVRLLRGWRSWVDFQEETSDG